MITGNDMVVGKKTVDTNETKAVTSNKITLDKTPKGALISVYLVNPDGTNGQEFTLGDPITKDKEYKLTDKELSFHTTVVNGTNIRVYYQVETDVTAKTMKVSSDAFGGTFRVVLDVLVRDEFTKEDYAGQLRIPNAKFEDNFNFSFSADGRICRLIQ